VKRSGHTGVDGFHRAALKDPGSVDDDINVPNRFMPHAWGQSLRQVHFEKANSGEGFNDPANVSHGRDHVNIMRNQLTEDLSSNEATSTKNKHPHSCPFAMS
jgi:hypothetical protein